MRANVSILLILCFGLLSCKKDKLIGDYAVLEGRWVWVESEKIHNASLVRILDPSSESFNATICFIEKGRVEMLRDEEIEYKGRTDVYDWSPNITPDYSVAYAINVRTLYRKNYDLQGLLSLSGDTMYVSDYPILSSELGQGFSNMWVRDQ